MEIAVLVLILGFVGYTFQARDERKRIALLGHYLGQYQIEKLMETLTEGYLRALGEPDAQRQAQIWSILTTTETALCEQFRRFVKDLAKVDGDVARVSKLPVSIFYTGKLFPTESFDLRKVLAIHAHGIEQAVANSTQRSDKDKAFTVLAEIFLMQHTCHWFCKSKAVASTRLVMRHQTPYAKVLDSVAADTRHAYCALTTR
ncbi:MAG: hypothetical protein WCH60_01550 [Burkholderiales bacterium]